MAEEIKEIPDTGTRKVRIDAVCIVLTLGWILTILAVLNDWITEDQAKLVGVTFDRWWVGVGLMVGGWVASENAKKHSFAVLNK